MRRLVGGLLMAVGGLIALLSGLCTSAWFVYLVWNIADEGARGHGGAQVARALAAMSVTGAVVGGVPLAIGVGLFIAGRSLLKRRP